MWEEVGSAGWIEFEIGLWMFFFIDLKGIREIAFKSPLNSFNNLVHTLSMELN